MEGSRAAVAKKYLTNFRELWIITGPIYDDPIQRLESGVAVPYAFFKVIVDVTDEKQLRALSFVMPQAVTGSDLVEAYLVSIDQIESATGLDLMSMLEDRLEDDLESRAAYRFW